MPVSTYITNKMMGYVGKPLGTEIAGIVTKTGKKVTHVKVGDAVFGKTAGTAPVGGIAEYAVMDADRVCRKPDTLRVKEQLDGRYIYKQTPFFMRGVFKGTKPKYGRFLAEGTIHYMDGENSFTETGDLIYEFAYVGEEYRKFMEQS